MTTKNELIITALQQRIGEIVANYETQMAVLRADFTIKVKEQESQNLLFQDSIENPE